MEQKKFTLLHVKEIPFNMNLDVANMDDDMRKRLGVSFLFVFQYQKGNGASALHTVIQVSLDDSVILRGGATFIFSSKAWDEMPHDSKTVEKSDFAKEMVEYTLPFVNGIMLVRVQDTALKGLLLPTVDTSELIKDIRVEELPRGSKH